MKLVFFGTPDFAVPTLDALHQSHHDILGVITSPNRKSGRGQKIQSPSIKRRAEKLNISEVPPDIFVIVTPVI